MTPAHVSFSVGGVSAFGAAFLQHATGVPMSNISFAVPLVSAIVGAAMSYAVLRATVTKLDRDVRDMRRDMSEIYSLLRDAMTKIAHIEGRLDSSSN
jgi:hypothetical protein